MMYCGLDLSTSCSGFSFFDNNTLVKYGAIKPRGDDWRIRIMEESNQLICLLKKYKPDKIFIEDVPLKPGTNTLLKLGAVHGMILTISSQLKLNPVFLLPNQWRKKIGLYDGTREGLKRDVLKEKAIIMANEVFGLDLKWFGAKSKKSDDDIAEGILIAYSQII